MDFTNFSNIYLFNYIIKYKKQFKINYILNSKIKNKY